MFEFERIAASPGLIWTYSLLSILAALLVLGVLHFLPRQGKKYLLIFLTFAAGAVYVVEYFWTPGPGGEPNPLTEYTSLIGNVLQVVAGFALLLGIYNLVYIHFNNIRRRRPTQAYSGIFFFFFFAMVVAAFWREWYIWFGPPPEALTAADLPPDFILDRDALEPALRNRLGLPPVPPAFNPLYANDLFTYLFRGLYVNLEATMFSILAFYIVSAAYRAFRVRSGDAALMMVTAVILMAGQVPLGMALTNWIPPDGDFAGLRIENLSYWILSVINMPVQRAIEFGVGLGALAMGIRIWLSLESGTYFGEEA